MNPAEGDKIAVWFSSGAASAVAAKLTADRYGNLCDVHLVNNPVAEESPDNLRFLRDVEAWIGIEVEFARHTDYPKASAVEVWDRRGGMAFPHGAPCTVHLKKEARQQWEAINRPDWHVLGFTADERRRYERFVLTERSNVLPVLIEAGLTKKHCFAMLADAGIELPEVYAQGYPNANCIGCVKATSPTYWKPRAPASPGGFCRPSRAIQAPWCQARAGKRSPHLSGRTRPERDRPSPQVDYIANLRGLGCFRVGDGHHAWHRHLLDDPNLYLRLRVRLDKKPLRNPKK